jgi:predicted kinase/predicted short-subunit dehydrogenase-like oxidoreductase (DUF2520 family)
MRSDAGHETTLHLTCGLPGSGKTTLARRLAVERDAQRFSKDDWVLALGGDLYDEQLRVRVEAPLIELGFELLTAGRSCILDFGLWSREERDALRLRARRLGVRVELHVVDVDLDELVRRCSRRYADTPHTTAEISAEQLAIWASSFEAPGDAERRLFDSAEHDSVAESPSHRFPTGRGLTVLSRPRRTLSASHMRDDTVVIGAGRVGSVVAARLGARAYGRGEDIPLDGVRLVGIATPDGAIAEVCAALASRLEPTTAVVHFSGATSVHALDPAPGPKACVHPVQTVWPDRGPGQLEGAHAAVTGDWETGAGLARDLGLEPFPLADEMKVIYHAAMVFASNYLVTVTATAVELLERTGLDRELALRVLAPLQHRTVDVAGEAPTGPIARGDAETVAAHLDAIDPELAALYRALGRATLPLVDPRAAAAVRDLL